MDKFNIFAPTSPSFSSKVTTLSSVPHRISQKQVWILCSPSFPTKICCTVPIYDGRKHQLNVPNELQKIPDLLPHYVGEIPEFTLALLAYMVSMYIPNSGAHKDLVTTSLNIHFGVILHEPLWALGDEASASGNEEKDAEN